MKTIFNAITVNYSEYNYFKSLPDSEKVQFFFELYEAVTIKHSGAIDLSKFFESIKDLDQHEETESESLSEPVSNYDMTADTEQVAIMIDDENVMLESNSLRATKHIIYKFFESGYILCRNKDMEKMFRKDKNTRYLRIFNIVDQISSLCTN